MSEPEGGGGDAPRKEPAWLTKLATVAAQAPANHQRYRNARLGSTGAANAGKRVTTWSCACGWSGSSQELKAGAGGVCCPACGGAPQAG
jgi:hypothetical protein